MSAKLVRINKKKAIEIMEENLRLLKECSDMDTFLLLSYDLENESFIGRSRLNFDGGIKLTQKTKTFILNKEDMSDDPVSILSIYTHRQKDIYNIEKKGKKHDMIIVPQLV